MVRMHAARALGRMGPVAAPHADSLASLLAKPHEEASVRRACADALPKLGEAGALALAECLWVKHPDVRLLAAEALARTSKGPGSPDGLIVLDKSLEKLLAEANWDWSRRSQIHGDSERLRSLAGVIAAAHKNI